MTFTRRAFLRTLAGTSFAAATLRRWEAWAQTATFPKRLLVVYTSAGRDTESYCSGTGPGFTLSPGYSALAPYKDKLLILDGVRIPAHVNEKHPNGRCSMLTARKATASGATGQSIDRFLANALTQGKSVFCGGSGTSPNSGNGAIDMPISWQGANSPNSNFLDGAQSVLRALFPGGTTPPPSAPPPTSGGDDPAALNEHALNRHLIQEVEKLQRRVPRGDAERLQLHLTALQQLRASLPPISGSTPTSPPPSTLPTCNAALPMVMAENDAISLALAHAFACGQARIAVMRLGGDEPIHSYSHFGDSPNYLSQLRAQDRANAETVARLLGYLSQFKEGAGSVLSNTLVVWTSEVAGGYSGGDIHDFANVPFVLAGGLGGTVKTGQRILLSNSRTCGELYRTVAQAMGVNPAGFGDPSFGGTALPEMLV